MILRLCDRFHCTPEVALEMDASVLAMLKIEALGTPEQDEGSESG